MYVPLTLSLVKRANILFLQTLSLVYLNTDSPAEKRKVRELKKYPNKKTLLKRKIVLQKKREEAERKKKENRREAERAREAAARESAAAALLQLTAVIPEPQEPTSKDAVVQTDLTTSDIQCLEEKASNVRVVERFLLTDDVLKWNDDAVKFYTGLSTYSRLKAV